MGAKRTADGVFTLLSNEIRVDILQAVAIAQNEAEQAGTGITFLAIQTFDQASNWKTSR